MATTVVAECPKCAKKYRLQGAADAGKKIKCRGCGHVFVVPRPEAAAEDEFADDDFAGLDDFGDEPPAKLPTPKKAKKKPKPEKAEKPKEKRKAAARPSRGMSPALIGATVVLLLVLVGGAIFLFAGKREPMQAPTSFATFQQKDQEFQVDFPAGWETDDGGKPGSQSPPWAKAWKGDALIKVDTSVSGSLLGTIAGAGQDPNDTPDELKPVMGVHERQKEFYADKFSDYAESAPILLKEGSLETARSEFTAKGSWGSKVRGYRASLLGNKYQFTVMCSCAEEDWEALKPAFEKAIVSVR